MRIAGRPKLYAFADQHEDARAALEAWISEVEEADWDGPHQIRESYPRARLIGQGRVVFKIRHNRYRLDVLVDYRSGQVLVMRIGTHADYDRWTF